MSATGVNTLQDQPTNRSQSAPVPLDSEKTGAIPDLLELRESNPRKPTKEVPLFGGVEVSKLRTTWRGIFYGAAEGGDAADVQPAGHSRNPIEEPSVPHAREKYRQRVTQERNRPSKPCSPRSSQTCRPLSSASSRGAGCPWPRAGPGRAAGPTTPGPRPICTPGTARNSLASSKAP